MVLVCRPHPGCRLVVLQTLYQSINFKSPRVYIKLCLLSPGYLYKVRQNYKYEAIMFRKFITSFMLFLCDRVHFYKCFLLVHGCTYLSY